MDSSPSSSTMPSSSSSTMPSSSSSTFPSTSTTMPSSSSSSYPFTSAFRPFSRIVISSSTMPSLSSSSSTLSISRRRLFSTMEASSSSPTPPPPSSTRRKIMFSAQESFSPSPPFSPPPPLTFSSPPRYSSTSPPPSPEPQKRRDQNAPLRDPYRDPSSPPPHKETKFVRVAKKRRVREAKRCGSLLHGFALNQTATLLLETNDLAPLRTLVEEFAQLPDPKKDSKKKLFVSLSYSYPNSFSLKLAKLLSTQPPLHIRNEVVLLLRETLTETHGNDTKRISCAVIIELKTLLLESFKIELHEPLLVHLSETIVNVASRVYEYPLGGWEELLEYIFWSVCLNSDDGGSVSNQRKGLMLLADSSSDIYQNQEFWKHHYAGLYENLSARMLNETADESFQQVTFDALLTMLVIAQPLDEFDIGGEILLILMQCIDLHPRENVVVRRIQDFTDFVFLDIEEIMDGREEIVFQAMLRIAEKEDVNEEVRFVAVQLLKDLDETCMDSMERIIKELSDVDAQRIINISMDMLLCVEDDPLWFQIDDKESVFAGLSRSFKLGKFLLNWLSIEANGSLVVPLAIEFLKTTYAASEDWRTRHARMIVIAGFAEGGQNAQALVDCFVEVDKFIIESLNDWHPRVLWAAMNAVQCLSTYKTIPGEKYHHHMKFFCKLFGILRFNCYPQVQVKAVEAINSLMKNCCLDKMVAFGEETVIVTLELLMNDNQKLQEEAVQTLESVAALIPTQFFKYYDKAMELLKAILFYDFSKPKLLLRAKSLEFLSTILWRYKSAHFTNEDAFKVVSTLILLEQQLSSTDYLVRKHILKGLDQFCRCPGLTSNEYIIPLMPMLLRSAELDIKLKDNMLAKDSCSAETVKVQALNIMSHCACRSWQLFSLHIDRASKIFADCLACSSVAVRKASVPALPSLFHCAKLGEQGAMPVFLVKSLVEALHKETDDTVSMSMLKTLPTCIQITGSNFTKELIQKIADEINHILSTWCNKLIERHSTQEAGNPGTSEGGRGDLPDEQIIQGAKVLIRDTVEILKGRFSPHIDDILSNVAKLWAPNFPERVREIAVSIFNVIVPHFPDKLQRFYSTYTYELFKARDGNLQAQQETARGIGICAMLDASNFKTIVHMALSKLYSLIELGRSIEGEESGDGAILSDMAVSALGNICEFQPEHIDGPQVIQSWLNFLPISNDTDEAKKVHAQLSKMLRREDADVLGPNQENLPKILSIFREILIRSEELVTEETFSEIIEFMDQHGDGL